MGRRKKVMNLTVNFVRLTGLLVLWIACSLEGFFASAGDPGFKSGETAGGARYFDIFQVFISPVANRGFSTVQFPAPVPAPAPEPATAPESAPAPAPAPETGSTSYPPPSRGHHLFIKDPGFKKARLNGSKGNLKYGRTVGYLFVVIASLLQVTLLVFLLIKRRQMIGLVKKYEENPPELQSRWNGVYGPSA